MQSKVHEIFLSDEPILRLVLLTEQVVQLVLLATQHGWVVLSEQLAFLPRPTHLLVILLHNPVTVLFPILPVPNLLLAILPEELAEPVFLVILVVAFLDPPVWPGEDAVAVYAVVLPRTLKYPAIHPGVLAVPVNVVFREVTGVATPVCPLELTLAVFESVHLAANILRPVVEDFHAVAVLFVEDPVPLVV